MQRKHLLWSAFLLLWAVSAYSQKLDTDLLENLEPRSVGPAGMSGRITSIDVHPTHKNLIYVASSAGGVWMSDDGGIYWEPIFDEQPLQSVGVVKISPSNPDIIWAGTGEGNPRNSQSSGAGIYKSLDGGKNWTLMGLEDTRTIHRIIVHPENPDVVYVAATGNAWADSPARGVYKTTDGGKNWRKILYRNERTGAADLVMDPENPEKLFAAMWEYRRWPWFFKSGGAGSGLFVTHDGGETWTERTAKDGLPKGELGRIGLAIAPSNPDRVYAYVESRKNAIYRSDDGGVKWRKMSDGDNIGGRPFYYADIFVDPQNENRIYSLYSRVSKSEDGGRSFQVFLPYSRIHPDHHAWWIDPDNPDFMIDGNDGGLNITRDGGKHWRFVENLPLAQFYHISVDNEFPYNIYGGMQDNGSWRGPNRVFRRGGIRNAYWEELYFGDGFDAIPDPSNPRYGYAMSQGGFVGRVDFETGDSRLIRPVHPEGETLRFNWDAPIATDPNDPTTIYFGSQFVHRSLDRGETWEIISPDLTTNDPEKQKQLESGGLTYDVTQAENYTTLLCITPSPKNSKLIWVGSDDGRLHLTRDGGENWEDLYDRLPDAPEGGWIPQVKASVHNEGEAFVVVNNYRKGDWGMYVYRTRDFGKKWTRIADSEVPGYARSFIQDTEEPNLYFLGTEFGLQVSIDAGKTWTKWDKGLPSVSISDLAIQEDRGDLVIGTFGRSAYVLDDIRPLRELAKSSDILKKDLHVFAAPDAYQAVVRQAAGTRFAGEAMYKGENRPFGALLTYSVREGKIPDWAEKEEAKDENEDEESDEEKDEKVKIEIVDSEGKVIRTLMHEPDSGINRITWRLDRKGVRFPDDEKPKKADAPERGGLPILPGTYTVRMSYRGATDSTEVNVLEDPRLESTGDRVAGHKMLMEFMDKVEVATEAADRLRKAKADIAMMSKLLDEEHEAHKAALDAGKAAQKQIKTLMEALVPKEDVQGIFRNPDVLSAKLGMASYYLYDGTPNQTHRDLVRLATADMQEVIEAVNAFMDNEWKAYVEAVKTANPMPFEDWESLKMD